mmetsp:Transcript_99676/g.287762  ORF Transcript_99676/g.287762 Transcript_99676/m.287762 type:complete len:267 (+) Transcript_99676:1694-2494(+)
MGVARNADIVGRVCEIRTARHDAVVRRDDVVSLEDWHAAILTMKKCLVLVEGSEGRARGLHGPHLCQDAWTGDLQLRQRHEVLRHLRRQQLPETSGALSPLATAAVDAGVRECLPVQRQLAAAIPAQLVHQALLAEEVELPACQRNREQFQQGAGCEVGDEPRRILGRLAQRPGRPSAMHRTAHLAANQMRSAAAGGKRLRCCDMCASGAWHSQSRGLMERRYRRRSLRLLQWQARGNHNNASPRRQSGWELMERHWRRQRLQLLQ